MDQKIKTFLWYDGGAEAAVNHYIKAFKNSSIDFISRQGDNVFVIEFTLAGQHYIALNGGSMFKPTEATSLFVSCDDQAEVDFLWEHLTKGGTASRCGWLKDQWGYSWQIVPKRFMEMMKDQTEGKASRVMAAMMQMGKFDIAELEKAYAG